jgi:hypothetical protein
MRAASVNIDAVTCATACKYPTGIVSADGSDAQPDSNAGGGSGGSVTIYTNTISGVGNITAHGGSGEGTAGGGGGGRIFIQVLILPLLLLLQFSIL